MSYFHYTDWFSETCFQYLNFIRLLMFPIFITIYVQTFTVFFKDSSIIQSPIQVDPETVREGMKSVTKFAMENPGKTGVIFTFGGTWLLSSKYKYGANQKAQMVIAEERYKHILQNIELQNEGALSQLEEIEIIRFFGDNDPLSIAFHDLKRVLKGNPTLVAEYREKLIDVVFASREEALRRHFQDKEVYLPEAAQNLKNNAIIPSVVESSSFWFFIE